MKKRLGGISNASTGTIERPFFDVSVELSVPRVTMNPTLDDIQAAINATAKKVDRSIQIISVPIKCAVNFTSTKPDFECAVKHCCSQSDVASQHTGAVITACISVCGRDVKFQ